jgi:hypothetical protein
MSTLPPGWDEDTWRRFYSYPTAEDREQALAALAGLRGRDAA